MVSMAFTGVYRRLQALNCGCWSLETRERHAARMTQVKDSHLIYCFQKSCHVYIAETAISENMLAMRHKLSRIVLLTNLKSQDGTYTHEIDFLAVKQTMWHSVLQILPSLRFAKHMLTPKVQPVCRN